MRLVIGTVLKISKDIAKEYFGNDEAVRESIGIISALPDCLLRAIFYDNLEEKLYMHFEEPVNEAVMRELGFAEAELIFKS